MKPRLSDQPQGRLTQLWWRRIQLISGDASVIARSLGFEAIQTAAAEKVQIASRRSQ
jgi:hypothetical protein